MLVSTDESNKLINNHFVMPKDFSENFSEGVN